MQRRRRERLRHRRWRLPASEDGSSSSDDDDDDGSGGGGGVDGGVVSGVGDAAGVDSVAALASRFAAMGAHGLARSVGAMAMPHLAAREYLCAVCDRALLDADPIVDFSSGSGCTHAAHSSCADAMAALGAQGVVDGEACPLCDHGDHHDHHHHRPSYVTSWGHERHEAEERRVVRGYVRARVAVARGEASWETLRGGSGQVGHNGGADGSADAGRLDDVAEAVGAALAFWHRCASAGDAQAQFNLGMVALAGHGAKRNPKSARLWLRKAAEAGHLAAQFEYGLLLLRSGAGDDSGGGGIGGGGGGDASSVAAKMQGGLAWLVAAAEAGHAGAQCALGAACEAGEGPQQRGRRPAQKGGGGRRDYAGARRWYAEAARQGHAEAQYLLGALVYAGRGAAKGHGRRDAARDAAAALGWFELAAAQGHGAALRSVGICERKLLEAAGLAI
jgi:TPR repeat protein